MEQAGLDGGFLPGRADRAGQALQAVADHDADVLDAAVPQLGQHCHPRGRTLALGADPQTEDAFAAVHVDADDQTDRLRGYRTRVDRQVTSSSITASVALLIRSGPTSTPAEVFAFSWGLSAGRLRRSGQVVVGRTAQ